MSSDGSMLDAVVGAVRDAVVIIDDCGQVTLWNSAAEAIFGWTAEEMTGRDVHELLAPVRYHDAIRRGLARFRETGAGDAIGKTHRLSALRRDGAEIPVELSLGALEIGGRWHAVGVIRDVTAWVETEAELRASEQRLRTVFEHLQTGVLVVDRHTAEIVDVNPVAAEVIGLPREEIVGSRSDRFHGQADREAIDLDDRGVAVENEERELLTADARRVPVLRTVVPVILGGRECLLESFVDISQQKEVQRRLQEAGQAAERAARARSEFLANMSHEIRTPLNAVIGMTGILLETRLTPEQCEHARIIRTSGDALLAVINDVLDLSKIESGGLEIEAIPFEPRSLLEDVARMLAPKAQDKGLELTCSIASDVPESVAGDPGRIRQVVTNLVGNAVKFTSEGNVDVAVTLEEADGERATLRLSVSDSGIGIPADRLDSVFESFTQVDGSTTRRFGGTGLGLTISRRLVQSMGGEIHVESEPGRGSRFWFVLTLPVDRTARRRPARGAVRGARVLVIDDNPTNRRILTEMLRAFECVAAEVASGPDALAELERAHSGGNPYEAILLDLQMPAMDGEEVARRIRERSLFEDLRILVLTSVGERGDARRFETMRCAAYLTKPIRRSELEDALSAALARSVDDGGPRDGIITRHSLREAVARHARVLLAEDNRVNRRVAHRILEKAGHHVEVVETGAEAVAAFEEGGYDLILMDVQMPEVDGIEATTRIRAAEGGRSRIPIIALTAHAFQSDRERCLGAGMDDFVTKPVQPEQLLSVVQRWAGADVVVRARHGVAETPLSSPVDVRRLDSIAGGDEGFRSELVALFLEETRGLLDRLRRSVSSADFEAARAQAHGIKGAAANIGADELREAAEDIERACITSTAEGLKGLVQRIEGRFKSVEETLGGTGPEER